MIGSVAVSNVSRIMRYLQAKKMDEKQQNSCSCMIRTPPKYVRCVLFEHRQSCSDTLSQFHPARNDMPGLVMYELLQLSQYPL